MPVSATYLARAELRLGAAAARHHPVTRASFAETAHMLGSDHGWVLAQWSALAQLAALHGVRPQEVNAEQLDAGGDDLLAAFAVPGHPKAGHRLRSSLVRLRATLFHSGMISTPPRLRKPNTGLTQATGWGQAAPALAETAERYLAQIALSLRPSTVRIAEHALRELAGYLARQAPDVTTVADIRRHHIEAYKSWLATRPRAGGGTLHRNTIRMHLSTLRCFFERITEWDYPDAPPRPLLFAGDLPIPDQPLPRFLDDAASAKPPAPPAPTPTRSPAWSSNYSPAPDCARRADGPGHRRRRTDRIGLLAAGAGREAAQRPLYPLHPQLKTLLDDWLTERPQGLRSDLIFLDWGRPIPHARVDRALAKVAAAAGIGKVTAHQLRHTLATQAINRGMSLEAIAALLGHRTMAMTMVYARIADRTVADEYFAVSEKVEALYDHGSLPADAEGTQMLKLRREMHSRMLGNGHCARPVEMDCHFETICESCTFFVTTIEFRPTLQRQRDDAAAKGQVGRQQIFDGLLNRLGDEAS